MARYYFHCHNGIEINDAEGKELPTLEAAFDYAREIGGVVGRRMADGTHSWTVVITDAYGDHVATVPIRV
jgi:hypothetical protein